MYFNKKKNDLLFNLIIVLNVSFATQEPWKSYDNKNVRVTIFNVSPAGQRITLKCITPTQIYYIVR